MMMMMVDCETDYHHEMVDYETDYHHEMVSCEMKKKMIKLRKVEMNLIVDHDIKSNLHPPPSYEDEMVECEMDGR